VVAPVPVELPPPAVRRERATLELETVPPQEEGRQTVQELRQAERSRRLRLALEWQREEKRRTVREPRQEERNRRLKQALERQREERR